MERLLGLHYLRALSALCVMSVHLVPKLHNGWSDTEFRLRVLAVGTATLLTITGYFVWITTSRTTHSPLGWLRRRFLRLIPLYWLCLACSAIYAIGPFPKPVRWLDIALPFFFVPARTSIFSPAWSIDMLVAFLCYATIALHIARPGLRVLFLVLLYVALLVLRSAFNLQSSVLLYATSPELMYFVGGVLIAWSRGWWTRGPIAVPLGCVSLTAGLLYLGLVSPQFFPDNRALCFGVPAILLVAGALGIEPLLGRSGRIGWLDAVGNASYSIFVSHSLFIQPFVSLLNLAQIEWWPVAYLIAAPVVTGFGLIVHRHVELPVTRFVSRHFDHAARPASAVKEHPPASMAGKRTF